MSMFYPCIRKRRLYGRVVQFREQFCCCTCILRKICHLCAVVTPDKAGVAHATVREHGTGRNAIADDNDMLRLRSGRVRSKRLSCQKNHTCQYRSRRMSEMDVFHTHNLPCVLHQAVPVTAVYLIVT